RDVVAASREIFGERLHSGLRRADLRWEVLRDEQDAELLLRLRDRAARESRWQGPCPARLRHLRLREELAVQRVDLAHEARNRVAIDHGRTSGLTHAHSLFWVCRESAQAARNRL